MENNTEQSCHSDRNPKHFKVEGKRRLFDNETASQETHVPTESKLVYCIEHKMKNFLETEFETLSNGRPDEEGITLS